MPSNSKGYDREYYHRVLKFKPEEVTKRRVRNSNNHYRQYGMTREQALESKKNGCTICGVREGKMNIDHDHETNVVRGVLCNPCNIMIGWVERSRRIAGIDEYLQRGKVQNAVGSGSQ